MTWYAVDGLDGSGKSTVAKLMKERSEEMGRSACICHHPSRSLPGKLSSRFLEGEGKVEEALTALFFIIDVLLSLLRMRTLCRDHDDVIFVRYSMAAAYLPSALAEPAYSLIEKALPRPDRLVLVDVAPELALERILERGEDLQLFESGPRLARVRERMMRLSLRGWEVLDNSSGIREAREAVASLMGPG